MAILNPDLVSTIQHRGATQIPEPVRKALGLREGDKVYWNVFDKDKVYLHKVLVEVRKP